MKRTHPGICRHHVPNIAMYNFLHTPVNIQCSDGLHSVQGMRVKWGPGLMSRGRANSDGRGHGSIPLDRAGTPGYPQCPSHSSTVSDVERVEGKKYNGMSKTDVARTSPRQHSPPLTSAHGGGHSPDSPQPAGPQGLPKTSTLAIARTPNVVVDAGSLQDGR